MNGPLHGRLSRRDRVPGTGVPPGAPRERLEERGRRCGLLCAVLTPGSRLALIAVIAGVPLLVLAALAGGWVAIILGAMAGALIAAVALEQ